MHTSLTTLVLCLAAHVASAQCVNSAPASTAAAPVQGMELIKTAAAGTRDDDAPPAMTARAHANGAQEHPRRGGTAMLLAALALMSGIALRRYGAPHQ